MLDFFYYILDFLSFLSISLFVFVLLTLWFLWILYVAMMNIQEAVSRDNLPWQAKIMVAPTSLVFDIVEFVANVLVCTLIFLDRPKEITVSARLRRYAADPDQYGWRLTIVRFVKPMLDPFDPKGPHI